MVCVSYDGFDETEDTIFPDMLTETKKVEKYIQKKFGGSISAAYGCSLGGSFSARLKTAVVTPMLAGLLRKDSIPRFMKKWIARRPEKERDYWRFYCKSSVQKTFCKGRDCVMGGSGKIHTLSRSVRFEEACFTGCPDGYTLKFDPRTELLFLVLANVVAFTQHSLWVEITWVVLLLLQYYVFLNRPKILASSFTILVSYARKVFPCLIVGTLILQKTSVRELMEALRKCRIPKGRIIPLSVTIRYFPALKEGVEFSFVNHPVDKTTETQGLVY